MKSIPKQTRNGTARSRILQGPQFQFWNRFRCRISLPALNLQSRMGHEMTEYLSTNDAASIAEAAFAPFRCVAKRHDYGNRLDFRVFDQDDEPILTVEDLVTSQFSHMNKLRNVLSSARQNLIERGYALLPWDPRTPAFQ